MQAELAMGDYLIDRYPIRPARQTDSSFRRLLNPAPELQLHGITSSGRSSIETYITSQFKKAHQANITEFMPWLLATKCMGGTSAVVGIRAAYATPLFLEQYLSEPLEEMLGQFEGEPVHRSKVAEIGNLVATQTGASQLLFVLLPELLQQVGFEWVVFTATSGVQGILNKLEIGFHVICEARLKKLPQQSQANWGNYYSNKPKVIAANIAEAVEQLQHRRLPNFISSYFANRVSALSRAFREG